MGTMKRADKALMLIDAAERRHRPGRRDVTASAALKAALCKTRACKVHFRWPHTEYHERRRRAGRGLGALISPGEFLMLPLFLYAMIYSLPYARRMISLHIIDASIDATYGLAHRRGRLLFCQDDAENSRI